MASPDRKIKGLRNWIVAASTSRLSALPFCICHARHARRTEHPDFRLPEITTM
jgi:hypothetical protein